MRFYTNQHPFYCGIAVHARSMYVCILTQEGEILLHRNLKAAPEPFLQAIAPYRDGLVVTTAKHHDATTLSLLQTVPGIGQVLSLVLL